MTRLFFACFVVAFFLAEARETPGDTLRRWSQDPEKMHKADDDTLMTDDNGRPIVVLGKDGVVLGEGPADRAPESNAHDDRDGEIDRKVDLTGGDDKIEKENDKDDKNSGLAAAVGFASAFGGALGLSLAALVLYRIRFHWDQGLRGPQLMLSIAMDMFIFGLLIWFYRRRTALPPVVTV